MKSVNPSFPCIHCQWQVVGSGAIGTAHRNHCPYCLWSKHVDKEKSGDRKSMCQAEMTPIVLTFKHEGFDKYGKVRQGELMIVHRCMECGKVNINRIAGDDSEETILLLLQQKNITNELGSILKQSDIDLLGKKDEDRVRKQLFGTHQVG